MLHENDLLSKLTQLRIQGQNTNNIDESVDLNNQIDNNIKQLKLTVEGYPELKSNQNFIHMQGSLNDVEEQISAARRNYNAHVEEYNTYIGKIPFIIFAFVFGFKQYKQFEISNEERESKIWM